MKINNPLHMKNNFKTILIAPCGMNCGLCSSYLSKKNNIKDKGIMVPYCTSCRVRNKQCAFLKKRCRLLLNNKVQYCFECHKFPCHNLAKLDAKYREKYKMSMVENLKEIKKSGINKFLASQEKKWRCPKCGRAICCHNGLCYHCDLAKLKRKKYIYRWQYY